ncbi:hypothetical protein Tco_1153995 [Tanacetum coccineum]
MTNLFTLSITELDLVYLKRFAILIITVLNSYISIYVTHATTTPMCLALGVEIHSVVVERQFSSFATSNLRLCLLLVMQLMLKIKQVILIVDAQIAVAVDTSCYYSQGCSLNALNRKSTRTDYIERIVRISDLIVSGDATRKRTIKRTIDIQNLEWLQKAKRRKPYGELKHYTMFLVHGRWQKAAAVIKITDFDNYHMCMELKATPQMHSNGKRKHMLTIDDPYNIRSVFGPEYYKSVFGRLDRSVLCSLLGPEGEELRTLVIKEAIRVTEAITIGIMVDTYNYIPSPLKTFIPNGNGIGTPLINA